ncbi:glycoside hydrolase family 2 [Massilia agilis]|uniref:Glycoside hydrolase family 2 n=1 Tax=Massilia agilis TaxID=1811226 RepID=A0ABT2DH10_9BURK|nr:glycoside hydrolase family 2 [Massilia agilis]
MTRPTIVPMDLPDTAFPYPRPQLVRAGWASLDGWWEFAFDDQDRGLDEGWYDGRPLARRIRVPFPYQSGTSGVGTREVHEIMWYSRSFEVPAGWTFGELLLHFGAVDYAAEVWVNGRMAGRNRGGHVPFYFNIAPYLRPGPNRVTVRVEDRQDPYQPRGKQSASGKPVRIYYWCTSGIWQSVWLEPVPAVRIDHLRILSAQPDGMLAVQANLHAPFGAWEAELDVFDGIESDHLIARTRAGTHAAHIVLSTRIASPQPWTPSNPHLYRLRVRLYHQGTLLDSVESYTGLRKIELRDGYFHLNGERIFLLMVLDQGYWPDTLLAAPSDAALRADIGWIKRFGFNGVRKHQKIECERWLYWCDRMGLMVWEEMPNARGWSTKAEERLLIEWLRAILRDLNHPSIIAWVPLVENLGFPELTMHPEQHSYLEQMVGRTRMLDATRPVIDNDGWHHTDLTDVCTIHDYTYPVDKLLARYTDTLRTGRPPDKGWSRDTSLFLDGARYRGQPIVLSEVGGYLMEASEVAPERRDRLYDAYGVVRSDGELAERYRVLMEGLATLPFLAGVCYTQLADIEHERNGLLTALREPKIDPDAVLALHRRLWPTA